MDAVVSALEAEQAGLTELLGSLDDAGWERPSRCDGWSVADVVLHLAQTNELAVASASGTLPPAMTELPPAGAIDDGADLRVAAERGVPARDLLARWRDGAAELARALRACDPHARVNWVAGTLAARTLATTRLAETWIHACDITHAFGRPPHASERLWHIARLAWRTLPYAFAQADRTPAGGIAFELAGADGSPWVFGDDDAATRVRGTALELCQVAARRVPPESTSLVAEGPDAVAVLALVRTWA